MPQVVAPTVVLTEAQISHYFSEGYLSIENISTPEEIERLAQAYDRIFSERAGRDVGDQFDLAGTDAEGERAALPQILGPSRYAPELIDTLLRANAESIAKQLLGPSVSFMGDHAIFKPAGYGAPTPWHQDEAYWNPAMEYNMFSLWVPFQPATLENGCLQFVPKSHLLKVLPHHCINDDPRIHGLEVDEADVSGAVPCPLSAGGCTIHHNRTLHYAGPNRSQIPRRAYILGFGLSAKPCLTPRTFPWNDQKKTARDERARSVQVDLPVK